MMSETSTTDYEIAVERVVGFLQQFDRAHFDLACHAAFPLVITPDLLYQIWLRFVPQAPWTAVARVLLSRLCREVGYELYEMDIAVRNLLLADIKDNEEFNTDKPRLEELADFLTSYVTQQFAGDNPHTKNLAQAQYWTALAYTKPGRLSRELLEAIEQKLQQKNWKELFRLSSLVETFAEPLAEFAPLLITYARGMASFTVGDVENATEQFSKLPRRDRLVDIDGVSLSIPDKVPLNTVDIDFLLSLLQVISDSNGDSQIVYPVLRENLDQIDYSLAELLRSWATTILPSVELEQAQEIATTITTLSNLLAEFPLGSRANNLEIAITGYEIAFVFFTRSNFPQQWGMLQNYLAVAYIERIRGDKAENLERAIACFQSALEIYSLVNYPEQWAMTQNNLGRAYNQRIRGDKAENLEQAIGCLENALQVYTPEAFPYNWAETQRNLAVAYRQRIRGEQAENIELAIYCCQKALQVYTIEAFPINWAATMNNLGFVYRDRILGERAENLEQAINCFMNALTVYTLDDFPQDWANTQNNLGIAYRDRIRGERAENLEQAINCFMNALAVCTRDAFPQQCAETQKNLGITYRDRIRGERAENLEQAIGCLEIALTVYTRASFPRNYLETIFNLALAYQDTRQLTSTYDAFANTIDTLESFHSETFYRWESKGEKQEFTELSNKVYQRMVEVCLQLGYTDKAIEYVERSKARSLVELLPNYNLYPKDNIPDSIRIGAITFTQIQSIIPDERTAILEWYLQDDSFQAFIITPQSDVPSVWQSSTWDSSALSDWANEYFQDYQKNKQHWQEQLSLRLQNLARILHLDEILHYLPETCDQLILIPHRFLHCVPLHTLLLTDGLCLLDRFPGGVRYVPSSQLLELVQTRQRLEFSHFFAIQNPNNDLAYTNIEVETIKQYFPHADVLAKAAATKDALNNLSLSLYHCLHFSGHVYFNSGSGLVSALILADSHIPTEPANSDPTQYLPLGKNMVIDLSNCLTLEEIFKLDLSQCRLVTLSANETALTDWTSASDESIGFPIAFLFAGSTSVVGSLWSDNPLSTALLMIKFYQNQNLQTGSKVAVALNQAQLWLRDITKAELKAWITDNLLQLDPTMRQTLSKRIHKFQDDQKPFQDPFHWAAFCAIGQ